MLETKFINNIAQIKIIRSTMFFSVNFSCYYVDNMLIDTGPVASHNEIVRYFKDLPVDKLVNTHSHEDHVGNNFWFIEHKNCGPALVHKKAIPQITHAEGKYAKIPDYRVYVCGVPPSSAAVDIGTEVETEHYKFQVIETPGHCDDHICLWEAEQGWIFTGDLFLSEKAAVFLKSGDYNDLVNSLKKILKLDFENLFCANGRIIEKDARKAVRAKIEFLEQTENQVRYLYDKGWGPEDIRDRILGRDERFALTGGEYCKLNLVNSILAAI
jgi:glyoxylase-like metal-dependent hydrolase (beta-lactamase superfamily II)